MHSKAWISILVWVAVLRSTRVVSDKISEQQKLQVANKLNMLVQHTGWQYMNDVTISVKYRGEIMNPISDMLEAMSSNRKLVDESNVLERHKEIATVLGCKYGEIISKYKALVNKFLWVCQNEKCNHLFQKYFDCFGLLLIKLHSMSPRFKCMVDALGYIYSLVPQSRPKHSVIDAAEKLTDYTLTVGPTTSSKLSEHGTTLISVDIEIKSISDYISNVYNDNVAGFIYNYCNRPTNRKWSARSLSDEYLNAKSNLLIPEETSMLQYLVDEIDSFVSEIFGKWFYDLGFVYGVEGNITIGTNQNIISTDQPIYSEH